ncbi:MAG: ferritin-like domain-containing protein [Rhodobacteraceae bacterium]|nr:ferritin-like domain-containing protein [Paracoccaceae bacterium]
MSNLTLSEMAVEVLTTADGRAKTALSHKYAARWFAARAAGEVIEIGNAVPPLRPARPEKPELLSPRDVPRRRPGSPEGRIALLHAVAHIELNAVDLHWDIIARFTDTPMPIGFYDDWVKSADEESKHFNLICDCLEAMGSHYGALAAHAGMWRAAEDTAEDFMGRLAVVPMVLEARGLDVTPGMIEIFQKAKEEQTIAALHTIYAEEVGHVAYGAKWFNFLCGRDNLDPKGVFHSLVDRYFHSKLKAPFNEEKRAEAGLPPDFYWPLADELPPPYAR